LQNVRGHFSAIAERRLNVTRVAAELILVFIAQILSAQSGSQPEQEIRKCEAERSKAQVQGDAAKLDQLLAPEFIEVGSAGQIRTKKENIEGHKSGQVHWEQFDLDDLNVRVYGETALVTGRLTRKGSVGGQDLNGQSRYTRYYVRRKGRWQAIFQHSVPIAMANEAGSL
jgi:ketosteroid isomerase-like protein